MKEISIDTEFVTLGQLLKLTDAISSGGQAKWFLAENDVYVNGEVDNRRGRKIYDGDVVNGEVEDRRGRKIYNGDVVNIPGNGRFKITSTFGEK